MIENKKSYRMEKIFPLINTALLSAALVLFLNSYFLLKQPDLLILILAAGGSLLLNLLFRNRTNPFAYCIVGGILAGTLLISYLFKYNILTGFYKVYRWCLSYDGTDESYHRAYALVTILVLQFGACIMFFLTDRIKHSKVLAAIFLPSLLILLTVWEIPVPKLTILVILCYSLTVLSKVRGKKYSRTNTIAGSAQAAMYLVPFCLFIAIFAVSMPSHPEPIKWQGFKNLVKRLDRQGTIWMTKLEYLFDRTGLEFGLRYSGYSEDNGELGGGLETDQTTTLFIKTKKQSTAKGYLIGAVSDTYTGRKWEKSTGEDGFTKPDYIYDFYELLSFFTKVKEAGIDTDNLVQKRNFTIEYNDLKTRSLFYPLKTLNIHFIKKPNYQDTLQGAILFDKAKGIGTKYEVEYYELNLESNTLKLLLKEAENYDSISNRKAFAEALDKESKKVFYHDFSKSGIHIDQMEEELKRRALGIKEQYTQLPKELPDRVYLLAKELTKESKSDYDRLRAIESYLNTLTYTTNIAKTPKGKDFVDYFLFEQQEGYCTYFATAMGVLARCAGIPTRYVEGFVVDYESMMDKDTYEVISSNAHAWIEAYIDGVGWIPFEPTPPFTSGRYAQWKDKIDPYAYTEVSSHQAEVEDMSVSYQDMVEGVKESVTNDTKSLGRKNHVPAIFGITAVILFLTVSLFFVYYRILMNRYNQKFKKASGNEKLFILFHELLRCLGKDGYRLLADETLTAFSERIGERFCYDTIIFSVVAEIFMKVRYGNYVASESQLNLITSFLTQYKKDLIKKRGKVKMFFDRFLYLHVNQ
ncbi:hypothetical protein acsn021_00830 [Anaerocolumna cellulosilytica]|uniref:Uncharacterized protein n=1 Tax=Anaerocolumna cellulosilytica TaxID=433286 RepID=A0A6S6QPL4_9FIRM|nr:transglutaminase domain-containing protein [Anaerocolumna cellulosilytica]MBB5196166.1 hypothetical protein [Anaerocolumna cellulosilytica]BCJ92514.1 hypothetical protein acsn021_00830 [Anaerocolumna cellulosilytica]